MFLRITCSTKSTNRSSSRCILLIPRVFCLVPFVSLISLPLVSLLLPPLPLLLEPKRWQINLATLLLKVLLLDLRIILVLDTLFLEPHILEHSLHPHIILILHFITAHNHLRVKFILQSALSRIHHWFQLHLASILQFSFALLIVSIYTNKLCCFSHCFIHCYCFILLFCHFYFEWTYFVEMEVPPSYHIAWTLFLTYFALTSLQPTPHPPKIIFQHFSFFRSGNRFHICILYTFVNV